MIIKTVDVAKCNKGDILAYDILNDYGVALVAKDTIINAYIIERLKSYGIKSIKIYYKSSSIVEEFKKSYTEVLLQTKDIFQDIISGKPLDYDRVSYVTEKIYSSINENDKIISFLNFIQDTDGYTYTHCVNVAFYSMLIAKWLHFTERKVKLAAKSGLLHDVGKIKVPNEILNKKGKLTKEEFDIIKEHTVLGYDLIKDIKEIEDEIKSAVLLHHERVDGSGYPYHFYSDNVNLFARIVAIADVFDAMTSDRVYRDKSTPFDVLAMFKTIGIGRFDTQVLNLFISKLSTFLVGSKVLLSSGKTGEIVFIPLQNITCPIVRVESEYIDLSRSEDIKIVNMLPESDS
jgi:putative nucleotidyltransferase with HDIG domain